MLNTSSGTGHADPLHFRYQPETEGSLTIAKQTNEPVRVSVDVPQARYDVYDFLDVLANHSLFTGHMFCDWHYDGLARGAASPAS